MNDTLDAVIGPLNVAAEYVDRISKGDIPPKITDTYHGDFNEIKNNLNGCIDEIGVLVDEVGVIINAARDGKLDIRSDADKAKGVYRKILRGMNDALDAVIGRMWTGSARAISRPRSPIPTTATSTRSRTT